jgi:2-hydroxychromene-2-carboxylate isomerase
VRWSPILMTAIFKVTGGVPLPFVPIKGAYIVRDFERTARFHGIAFRKPDNFPILTLGAGRAMLWIQSLHGSALAVEFAKRCYRAYFTEGMDITDNEVLLGIGAGLDVDRLALLEGIQTSSTKEMFKQENEAAIQKGVFGSPFVIVDGEPFWGFDRFDQIEACLATG